MIDFNPKDRYNMEDLTEIMALLRSPEGCPWDREQTHDSIRRNFIEEVYEAADAIDRRDDANLREELGDVLLQVVFHARIAQEGGRFDLSDVIDEVCKKIGPASPSHFWGHGGKYFGRGAEKLGPNQKRGKRAENGVSEPGADSYQLAGAGICRQNAEQSGQRRLGLSAGRGGDGRFEPAAGFVAAGCGPRRKSGRRIGRAFVCRRSGRARPGSRFGGGAVSGVPAFFGGFPTRGRGPIEDHQISRKSAG